MFGFDKKKNTANSYIVPQNSTIKLEQNQTAIKEHISNLKENHYERNNMNKCPHCENMAKNFLYLESLIRNNCDKNQKCSLCQSSLKYLQYVNRNIMQVFGNFDSIVQAARVFSSQAPPTPKYSVKKPQEQQQQQLQQTPVRARGGALIHPQKSSKTLKSVKSQKSKKSLKSLKSIKASKSGKSVSKSNKNKRKTATKTHTGHGKMVLKSKFKSKPAKLASQLSKVVRSASQYQNLLSIRSKLTNSKKQKNKRLQPPPTSINWNLLKRNLPKRIKPIGIN